ncbi:AraC family transcriptional regulator [Actinacidiphila guanduensis]|nr:AraC family transcriptional regulator [Actinacidiphila guanduensis]
MDSREQLRLAARASYASAAAAAGHSFRGELVLQELGGSVRLTRANCDSLSIRRADHRQDTPLDDLMRFCMHVRGEGSLLQHGRRTEVRSGEGVLYEARRAWELEFPSRFDSLTLQFPRSLMPRDLQNVTARCAQPVDTTSTAARLAAGFLGHLHSTAAGLTPRQRHDAGMAAVNLVAMMIRGIAPSPPADDGSDAVLLRMVQCCVRRHFSDPALTVVELARRHHISLRRLYSLFEGAGTTPSACIRKERLRAAEALLADRRYRDRTVAHVAESVGFAQVRTLERLFLREHGVPPGEWRRRHMLRDD